MHTSVCRIWEGEISVRNLSTDLFFFSNWRYTNENAKCPWGSSLAIDMRTSKGGQLTCFCCRVVWVMYGFILRQLLLHLLFSSCLPLLLITRPSDVSASLHRLDWNLLSGRTVSRTYILFRTLLCHIRLQFFSFCVVSRLLCTFD